MADKFLLKPPKEVILARLKVFLDSVNTLYQSGDLYIEQELISSYHNALSLFYESSIRSVLGTTQDFYPGLPADPNVMNEFNFAISQELQAIYAEIGALDKLISANFNSVIAEREQILQLNKQVANKLGNYL